MARKRAISWFFVSFLALSAVPSHSAGREQAVDWLRSVQSADEGAWEAFGADPAGLEFRALVTAAAASAVTGDPTALGSVRAEAWLQSRKAWSTVEAAAITEALVAVGADAGRAVQVLWDLQRPDGTWGAWKGWETDPAATVHALRALGLAGTSQAQVQPALDWLLARQRPMGDDDAGAWGWDEGEHVSAPVHVEDTARALLALTPYEAGGPQWTEISDGVTWLLTQQNPLPDAGFGDDPAGPGDETVVETALVALVLCESRRGTAGDLNDALDWLEREQDGAGHWDGGDVLSTALAVTAWGCGAPNLLVATADWTVPATATTGASVDLVAELVTNAGYRDAPGTTAEVFFRTGPSGTETSLGSYSVNAVDAETTVGQPAVTHSGWTPADGNWEACIRVDSTASVEEENELDNVTCKPIVVGPAFDLVVTNVAVDFDPAEAGEDFQLTFDVDNVGVQTANEVVVEVYATPPGGGPEALIETIPAEGDPVIDIPPTPVQSYSVTHRFDDEGPGSLRIKAFLRSGAADPTPANNEHQRNLDVVKPADLQVLRTNITVSNFEPGTGEQITVAFTADNVGGADMQGVVVTLHDGPPAPPASVRLASSAVTLAANTTTSVHSWTGSLADGCHDLWVEVTHGDARTQPTTNDATFVTVCWNQPNTPPTAVIVVSGPGPEGSPIGVSGQDSDDPDDGDAVQTWEWDLDFDGEYDDGTGAITEVTFIQPGTHTIGLRVTDGGGKTETTTATVTVTDVRAVVDAGPDVELLEGDRLTSWGAKVIDPGLLNSTNWVTVEGDDGSLVLHDGLTGSWHLNGDLGEHSGAGYDLELAPGMATATFDADGAHRDGLLLNDGSATGEWVGVDYPLSGPPCTRRDLSVSFWVRFDDIPDPDDESTTMLSYRRSGGTTMSFWVARLPGDDVEIAIANQTAEADLVAGELSDGAWHHVTVTWLRDGGDLTQSGRVRLYVDGESRALSPGRRNIGGGLPGYGYWMVGRGQQSYKVPIVGEPDLEGAIDELRIYGRELSQAEAESLYNDPPQLLRTPLSLTENVVGPYEKDYPDDAQEVYALRLDGTTGPCEAPDCAELLVDVSNAEPLADWGLHDLRAWADDDHPRNAFAPSGPEDPNQCSYPPPVGCNHGVWSRTNVTGYPGGAINDGTAASQDLNTDIPTVLAGQLWSTNSVIEVDVRVPWIWDDDYIGFVLGYRPEDDQEFDHLLLDWRRANGGTENQPGTERLALSRITGPLPELGSDGEDIELLATANTLGSTGWDYDRTYAFKFELLPDATRIWVDGSLEFDLEGCFSQGEFGLYTHSQEGVHFRQVRQGIFGAPEGSPVQIPAYYSDAGLVDVHHVDISWGDGRHDRALGSSLGAGTGRGTFTASHVYAQDGTYYPSLCLQDDDQGSDCSQATVRISNVPPSVDAADLAWTADEPAEIIATFFDPGILDTHRATVDWGDGNGHVPATVTETQGSGSVLAVEPTDAMGDLLPDGLRVVEICVEEIPRFFEDRTDFDFPDFAELAGLLLGGQAQSLVDDGKTVVRLTDDATQTGSLFWPDAVNVNADFSFSSVFELRMGDGQGADQGDGPGADGLAFVLAGSPVAGGSPGGTLGLDGVVPSLAIELDTWDDGAPQDAGGNHVGINLDGDPESDPAAAISGALVDAASRWVWIDYDGGSKALEVRVAEENARPLSADLTKTIDIFEHFGEELYVGFSAATHANHSDQDLRAWSFTSSYEPRSSCSLTGPARGCTSMVLDLERNDPPGCTIATSPQLVECPSGVLVEIEVMDIDGDELSWSWTTSSPDIAVSPTFGPDSGEPPVSSLLPDENGDYSFPATTVTWVGSPTDCAPGPFTLTLTINDGSVDGTPCDVVVDFTDTTAPVFESPPVDYTTECGTEPAAQQLAANDACQGSIGDISADPDVYTAIVPCDPQGIPPSAAWTLTRTWSVTDGCGTEGGNESQHVQVITLVDTTPPELVGVPADATVECDQVPTPASVSATDCREPHPAVEFDEASTPGADCTLDQIVETITRTWTATDACGNETSESQVLTVKDTTPPVIPASTEVVECLWPPNHQYVTLDQSWFSPQITDNCTDPMEISWVFTDCVSDQPDDSTGNGDGNTIDDCVVAGDGLSFQARAERAGREPAGRYYTLYAQATDDCGNESDGDPAYGNGVAIGRVHVPHDHRRRQVHDCISAHD